MDDKRTPLVVIMEQTKAEIVGSINETLSKVNLPAYLVEGIILGVLADIREQKTFEVVSECTAKEEGTDNG